MFNYSIKFDGQPTFVVKTLREIGFFFEDRQGELEVNGFEMEVDKIEIDKVDWSYDQAAEFLGTKTLIAGRDKDFEPIVLADYDPYGFCDFYLMFGAEDEIKLNID